MSRIVARTAVQLAKPAVLRPLALRPAVRSCVPVMVARGYSSHGSSSSSSRRSRTRWGAAAGVVGAGLLLGSVAFAEEKKAPPALAPVSAPGLASSAPVDYAAVRKAIVDILDVEGYDDGSRGPIFIRLAWHASGTWCKSTKTGGSEGAGMRHAGESSHGANAGLHIARDALETVKKQFPSISYADLWTLAGAVAIEEMGGPLIPWRSGRSDFPGPTSSVPDGRLPDATQGPQHVRDIFYRMGFNDQEIVALLGAHAVGRCHEDRSGFKGPWTRAPTTFSNEFFRVLLEEKWVENKTYTKAKQFQDATGDLMMLPADLALTQDPEFKKWVVAYAKDEALFFRDFAAAWTRLTEFGVKNLSTAPVFHKNSANPALTAVSPAPSLGASAASVGPQPSAKSASPVAPAASSASPTSAPAPAPGSFVRDGPATPAHPVHIPAKKEEAKKEEKKEEVSWFKKLFGGK